MGEGGRGLRARHQPRLAQLVVAGQVQRVQAARERQPVAPTGCRVAARLQRRMGSSRDAGWARHQSRMHGRGGAAGRRRL